MKCEATAQTMIDSIDCHHFSEAGRVKELGSRGADEGNCGNMMGGVVGQDC